MNGPGTALLVTEAPRGEFAEEARALGVDVTACAPGDVAAALAREPCDAVVAPLDAFAAGIGSAARRHDPHVQLVALTTPERALEAIALLRGDAVDVLVEPLAAPALASAVAAARERRSRARDAPLAAQAIRSSVSPRLGSSVAHELANRVAVLVSAASAIESALGVVHDLDALLATGDLARVERWWADDGRGAIGDAENAAKEADEITERLKSLARDLRTVLRADTASRTPFEVSEAVATALRLARPALAPVARVEVALPPRTPATGSPSAFARAVLELLLACADAFVAAGARGGHVRATWRADDGGAALLLEDDTPGDGGASLPVAVARDLLERQGGALVERAAASGVGRIFELRLPGPDAA